MVENDHFEKYLNVDPVLKQLASQMFFVQDGNHRLVAWTGYIDHMHPLDCSWHIHVDCIVVVFKGHTEIFFEAMNDMNW